VKNGKGKQDLTGIIEKTERKIKQKKQKYKQEKIGKTQKASPPRANWAAAHHGLY
jgi:hypothetical protein